jgi:chemotaxis signal transduction protein
MGARRVFFPFDSVDQVVTYRVTGPLPHGRRHWGGIAFWAGRAVISVNLESALEAGVRETVAVILRTPSSNATWGVEVTSVQGLGRVQLKAKAPAVPGLPSWVSEGLAADDGSKVAWLNAAEMVNSLGSLSGS